jgi:AcrR family transcriptional regulator
MARRLSAAERRERILRSAMDLFAHRGFSGVSTRELARGAGISEAMLFRHFPGKQDLYHAILERHLRDVESAMPLADLAASDAPPRRFFEGIAGTLLSRIEADPTLLRLMFFSALEGHSLAREFERARGRGLRGAIETYLRRRAREGMRLRVTPAVASRSFVWLVAGWGLSRVLFREPRARALPRARIVRDVAALFLAGAVAGAAP